jgi:hypothetical protein
MSVLSPASSSLANEPEDCPECLAGNLHWLLTQAHYALASAVAAALGPLGLSARGYAILSAALTGAYTQKQLADLVGLDKTTMDLHVSRRASRRIAMVTSSGGSPCPNSTSLSRRASTLHRSRSRSGEVPGGVFWPLDQCDQRGDRGVGRVKGISRNVERVRWERQPGAIADEAGVTRRQLGFQER